MHWTLSPAFFQPWYMWSCWKIAGATLKCMVMLQSRGQDLNCCWNLMNPGSRIATCIYFYSFMKTCESDVVKLSCGSMKRREGQVQLEHYNIPWHWALVLCSAVHVCTFFQLHSQEDTISCLMHNMENVTPSCRCSTGKESTWITITGCNCCCRKEILLIGELQADDYHLDRCLV